MPYLKYLMYLTPIPYARTLETTNSPYGLIQNAKEGAQKIAGRTVKTPLSHFCCLILCVPSSYEETPHHRTTYPRLRRLQRLFRRPAIAEHCGYH